MLSKHLKILRSLLQLLLHINELAAPSLKKMTARSQGQKESLQDYVVDKVWLCDGLEFSVSEQRDEITAGFSSQELARQSLLKSTHPPIASYKT